MTFHTLCLAIVALSAGGPTGSDARDRVEFNREIRPILSDHCFACHGPDKAKREADLRLDLRESALDLRAIAPGSIDESELYQRVIAEDSGEIMPPQHANKPLDARQKELLRRWIEQGAEYQAHWSFIRPERPTVPAAAGAAARASNAIDRFVLADLDAVGLEPVGPADPRTLVRRLSLDLLGLPPDPVEVEAHVRDPSHDAYEALVDRYLESPRYGERMAVAWLDLVRYADTVGYHGDQNQNAWPYRDYVIESFNKNKPFDRFTMEQLAGDLLPEPGSEQLTATCFNRLNMMTREGGAQPAEYLAKYAADRVRTVSMTWLGTTFGCAECHDHKFDPITTKDFYGMAAFFADIRQWGVYTDYTYTPNPDLAGYTNDHPFPPEITVASPYLERKIARLKERQRQVVEAASQNAKDQADFEAWRNQMIGFLQARPTGWTVPVPEVRVGKAKPDRKPQPSDRPSDSENDSAAATAQVSPESTIVFPGSEPTDDTIRVRPGAGWLATVRLELLADSARGGSILRTGESGRLGVALSVERADREKPERLRVSRAEANLTSARYASGFEILGIESGWHTWPGSKLEPHTGVWVLERPVLMGADDVLVLTINGNPAGSVRVSVSPLSQANPRSTGVEPTFVRSLLDAGKAADDPEVLMAHLRGTAWNQGAYDQVLAIDKEIRECRGGRSPVLIVEAAEPRVMRILPRGNWQDESGQVVVPSMPAFLGGDDPATGGRRLTRLDLARWLTAPENPLTARVFVNRLWKQFLGAGLCASVEDMGAQGEVPSHPELLDWLAVEFRESGWDVKHMVRLIVMSETYRQSSNPTKAMMDRDPGNRLLARQSPRRLEAEFVRDNALSIARLMTQDLGGPPSFPYQPPDYYENLQFPDRRYVDSADERQYRRGVYMHWQRTFLHPMLASFDAPSREDCVAQRTQANSPQQALTLLNDPTFVEAARVLAASLLAEAGSDAERIERLYRRALARDPSAAELESVKSFLERIRREYGSRPEDATRLLKVGLAPVADGMDPIELAAWTTACRVVLNLHETITRY